MLGISWVPAHLAFSQEWFSSLKLLQLTWPLLRLFVFCNLTSSWHKCSLHYHCAVTAAAPMRPHCYSSTTHRHDAELDSWQYSSHSQGATMQTNVKLNLVIRKLLPCIQVFGVHMHLTLPSIVSQQLSAELINGNITSLPHSLIPIVMHACARPRHYLCRR